MTDEKTMRRWVAAGVRWLNKYQPDWYVTAKPTTLDMANGCRCVLGQVFKKEAGDNLAGFDAVVRGEIPRLRRSGATGSGWAVRHGFDAEFRFDSLYDTGRQYQILGRLWGEQIRKARRLAELSR